MPCNSASVMLSVRIGLYVKLNVNLYICTGLVVSLSENKQIKTKGYYFFVLCYGLNMKFEHFEHGN